MSTDERTLLKYQRARDTARRKHKQFRHLTVTVGALDVILAGLWYLFLSWALSPAVTYEGALGMGILLIVSSVAAIGGTIGSVVAVSESRDTLEQAQWKYDDVTYDYTTRPLPPIGGTK